MSWCRSRAFAGGIGTMFGAVWRAIAVIALEPLAHAVGAALPFVQHPHHLRPPSTTLDPSASLSNLILPDALMTDVRAVVEAHQRRKAGPRGWS